jgi:hypothetical protein
MKKKDGSVSRRDFLAASSAAAFGFTLLPRHVLGGRISRRPPNG